MPLKVGRTLSDKKSKYLNYSQKLNKVLKISFEIFQVFASNHG